MPKQGWSEERESRQRAVLQMVETEGWRRFVKPWLTEKMSEAITRLVEKREPSIKTLQNERAVYKAHKGILDQVEAWSE